MALRDRVAGVLLLAALGGLGCGTLPGPWQRELPGAHVRAFAPGEIATLPLPFGCPYAGVYLAMSTNGSLRDVQVAERIRLAYADHLGTSGFQLVDSPEQAYWSAFSMVTSSQELAATFAWSVYMTATWDLAGDLRVPLRFASEFDPRDDMSGFMLLRELHLRELELHAQRAAEATASALLPHASQMCVAWVRDEAVREELAQEIQRTRQQQQQRRKSLHLETELDAGS